MTVKKKILIIAVIALLVLAVVGFTIHKKNEGVVTVQTGRVLRQSLTSVVSASGEIRPKNFVNVGANAFGKIIKLYVKEGQQVKQGQMLAQLENVQSAADVAANSAGLTVARSDAIAMEAGYKRALSDNERTKLEYQRAEGLFKAGLIPQSDYDAKKTAYEGAAAALAQAQAQHDSAKVRIDQQQATLRRASDVLSKTTYTAPFDGVVTNLPVREGETVVIGIQNSPGSTLMTIADLSVITAEVKVDETDIVNVKIGQPADVTIDAIPGQTFKGHVTEIGDNAMVRSTGVATTQTTSGSQEAKDFKVVVTIDNPPANLRPGLSTTAKITTATTTADTLTIPIQAVTVRQRGDLKEKAKDAKPDPMAKPSPEDKEEVQGVFVVRGKIAQFVPVKTGVTGTTDIEVKDGLTANDEIVTGSYKVLRTLKPGASVKIDNEAPKKEEEES
jgi:HlyD family secretion protein